MHKIVNKLASIPPLFVNWGDFLPCLFLGLLVVSLLVWMMTRNNNLVTDEKEIFSRYRPRNDYSKIMNLKRDGLKRAYFKKESETNDEPTWIFSTLILAIHDGDATVRFVYQSAIKDENCRTILSNLYSFNIIYSYA